MARKDITDADVVVAFAEASAFGWPDGLDRLQSATRQPARVCLRAAQRAEDRGLIDCGSNIRYSWPTPAGYELALVARGFHVKHSPPNLSKTEAARIVLPHMTLS